MKNRDKYPRQFKLISIKEAIRMVKNRIPKQDKESVKPCKG
jgi:hypothetical protein